MSSMPQTDTPPPAPETTTLKLTAVGDAVAMILPQAMLDRLQLHEGDFLSVTSTAQGFEAKAADEIFAEQMKVAEGVMRDNYDVLRRLAE